MLTVLREAQGVEGRVTLTTYGRADADAAATADSIATWWAAMTTLAEGRVD